MSLHRVRASLAVLLVAGAACGGGDDGAPPEAPAVARPVEGPPEVLPALRSAELPFRYPAALHDRRVQANVVLRLHVDSLGRVVPDSTQLAERSGHPEIDAAALAGSRALEFTPALRGGVPVGMTVLLPVHFRYRAPGDTLDGTLGDSGGGTQ